MKGTINEIWKAMKHSYHKCSADEEIGYASAMAYLHYLIRNSESFNVWVQAKELARAYEQKYMKMYLRFNDLEEDNKTLRNRNEKLEKLIGSPSLIKHFIDGFLKLEIETEHGNTHIYIKATQDEIAQHFEDACLSTTTNQLPRKPLKYIQDNMKHYYRKMGYEVK